MVLLDHQKELTVETFVVLMKAYAETSAKSYATAEHVYHNFRSKFPIAMHELMKRKESEWNLYVEKEPFDLERYIQTTWEAHGMNIPSFEHIHYVLNDLGFSYKTEKELFHNHQVVVW